MCERGYSECIVTQHRDWLGIGYLSPYFCLALLKVLLLCSPSGHSLCDSSADPPSPPQTHQVKNWALDFMSLSTELTCGSLCSLESSVSAESREQSYNLHSLCLQETLGPELVDLCTQGGCSPDSQEKNRKS